MKVGYLSSSNPFVDKKAWSGTLFRIREALEMSGCDVVWIPQHVSSFRRFILRKLVKVVYGGDPRYDQTGLYFRICARSVRKKDLKDSGLDILFIPTECQIAAYLDTTIPIISYGDATFKLMTNYYWFGMSQKLIKEANRCEAAGYAASSLILKSSDWSASSVVDDYMIPRNKVRVLEYGANVDIDTPSTPYERGKELRIIFSGVEWERKGGNIAAETVRLLNLYGIRSRLVILGIKNLPIELSSSGFVEHIGFLNKNNPEEYSKYIDVMKSGHLFLLPTKAECSATVLSEAAGFGLPVFTYDTGGLANYVENGNNGYRLPICSGPKDYADRIVASIISGEMAELREGALAIYKNKLSWAAWAHRFKMIYCQD